MGIEDLVEAHREDTTTGKMDHEVGGTVIRKEVVQKENKNQKHTGSHAGHCSVHGHIWQSHGKHRGPQAGRDGHSCFGTHSSSIGLGDFQQLFLIWGENKQRTLSWSFDMSGNYCCNELIEGKIKQRAQQLVSSVQTRDFLSSDPVHWCVEDCCLDCRVSWWVRIYLCGGWVQGSDWALFSSGPSGCMWPSSGPVTPTMSVTSWTSFPPTCTDNMEVSLFVGKAKYYKKE